MYSHSDRVLDQVYSQGPEDDCGDDEVGAYVDDADPATLAKEVAEVSPPAHPAHPPCSPCSPCSPCTSMPHSAPCSLGICRLDVVLLKSHELAFRGKSETEGSLVTLICSYCCTVMCSVVLVRSI